MPGMQGWFNMLKLIDAIHHINKIKKKNSIDAKKKKHLKNSASFHDKKNNSMFMDS